MILIPFAVGSYVMLVLICVASGLASGDVDWPVALYMPALIIVGLCAGVGVSVGAAWCVGRALGVW